MNIRFQCIAVFIFTLCIGSGSSYAVTDQQKLQMITEMQKLVQQSLEVLKDQQTDMEEKQRRESDEAQSVNHRLDNALKLAQYWVQRGQAQTIGESETAGWQKKLEELKAKKEKQEQADAQRKVEHDRQQEEMKQKTERLEADLGAAQTRFKAAMLLDRSDDYDYALGYALGAYSDPKWTPESPLATRCRISHGLKDGSVILDCQAEYNQ
jgi:hypothetical protein